MFSTLAFLFLVLKFLSLWWPQVCYPVNNFTQEIITREGWKTGYFSIWPSLEVIPRTIEVSRIWRKKLSTSASRSELNYRSALNFRSMFGWLGSVWSSLLFDKLNVYQHIFSNCTLCSWVVLPLSDLHFLSTRGLPPDTYRKLKVILNQKTYNRRKFSWETSGLRRFGGVRFKTVSGGETCIKCFSCKVFGTKGFCFCL